MGRLGAGAGKLAYPGLSGAVGSSLLGGGGGGGGPPVVSGGDGGSQAYLGPRGLRVCPGDMMIDRESPACGDAAARSMQAVRLALRGRTGGG
jgi:hypothetical protein